MSFWEDLSRGFRGVAMDDIVIRYNQLRRMELLGKLSKDGQGELKQLRQHMHLEK